MEQQNRKSQPITSETTQEKAFAENAINAANGGIADFPPIIPLTSRKKNLPTFPLEALPNVLRDYVVDVSESTQTAPDMAAVIGLGVLAVCLQGKYVIQGNPGYVEPLNLYVAVVANSGERKSPTLKSMTYPLQEYQAECFQKRKSEHSSDQLDDASATKATRLIADNSTSESLTKLLEENDGIMSVISSEGGIFDIMAGLYGGKTNIEIWLKGYCGDPVYVDRIGRKAEHIPNPTLSAILTVQPSIISTIMQNPVMSGRGLLARFLYAYPSSNIGHRHYLLTAIPDGNKKVAYEQMIYRLLNIPISVPRKTLLLSNDATNVIATYFDEHEKYLVGEGQALIDWGSKYIGTVLRIAGLLHGAEMSPDDYIVSANTMKKAIQIGKYFLEHACYAYSTGNYETILEQASFILSKIRKKGVYQIKRSELFQACRSKFFSSAKDLASPLAMLEEYGYLRQIIPEYRGFGRPQDICIEVNPAVWSK